MLRKLGIADAVQSKIKVLDVSAPLVVAKGEVEIGLVLRGRLGREQKCRWG
jgi:hypothetical protein